jgi:hypothetical protein
MKPLIVCASALAICLSACLDNEEDISIRTDGSASVRLSAEGDAKDLADGYPLPLAAPWVADGAQTLDWIRLVGPDTGSAATRENLARSGRGPIDTTHKVRLQVRADLPSVTSLPRWCAPESEIYRTAYLERTASLAIESKSGHRVFTFERAYRSREFERLDLFGQIKKHAPEDLITRLTHGDVLAEHERKQLSEIASRALVDTSAAFARDALGSVYTAGDASLPAATIAAVRAEVRAGLERVAGAERVRETIDAELPRDPTDPRVDESSPASGKTLERDVRAALRSTLNAAMESARVPVATQNAIRGELEWRLTAYDASCDLADETFKVTVHMPGTIVAGNYDALAGDAASWEFKGSDLQDRERVMRVVSIVE